MEDPQLTWHNLRNPSYLMGGKTIVGALVFGLIAVELMKRYIGVRQSTGDLYAIPLALGIAIGRIGCFLTGLSDNTYGTPTHLPWAINFGDNIPRHPTQLYEIIFLLALIPLLYKIVILSGAEVSRSETSVKSKDPLHVHRATAATRNPLNVFLPGDAFKFFMVAYLTFRLLCDFANQTRHDWRCAALEVCLLDGSADPNQDSAVLTLSIRTVMLFEIQPESDGSNQKAPL